MAIRIGHASIDENGNANSGAAGDQTGKEVLTRSWYDKPWNVVLRPKSETLAQRSAAACEAACANANIGYDQYARNTLYTKAKAAGFDIAAITDPCECDCSSLMHVCAIAGGANLTYGSNGHTTRTMVREFVNSGDYEKLTDSKYLSSDKYLKRGDILVKEGSHTAMALSNGDAVEAPAEEKTVTITLKTDEEILGTALIAEKLIGGEEGAYGLYVKEVNGVVADYDVDQTYWAFYIDGEFAMTGVDTTPIEEGKIYKLSKEKG